jgi:YegS/Rv2252/BmrU family lipid kinase
MPPAVAIILNGISRKKKRFYTELYPVLAKKLFLEVFETQKAGHAVELATQAKQKGFEFIVAAGGDGTVNQVINGVLAAKNDSSPALGLLPLGTGNDFARMCGLSTDPQRLVDLIEINQPKWVDVGRITCHHSVGTKVVSYFINACSIGMGPAVVQRLENSRRVLGPTLTYWKAITTTFLTHRPQEIQSKTPTWEWQGKIRVLAIANGRSFGNSIYIAPDALIDDGVLDTFIAGDLPLWKFLIYQTRLKTRRKINDKLIVYNRSTLIKLSAGDSCAIEAEGERVGLLPAEIEVLPKKVKFLR